HQGRPNHTNHRPNRPNHHPNRPNHRPGTPPPPPRKHKHNYRHHVPFFGAYHRPVPPPHHYNCHGGPTFGTILGVALGTAINISLNTLINNGYNVSSYGNNVVYLTNVPQMNFYWPDAALYYNNGILTGSQFTYATPYYDTSRYNSLYSTFISQYGYPASTVNNGHTMSATWYGPSNRFVTISFTSQYGNNFYTTLSFGD
ncbi:MAG: ABC transporter permease, partial [Muribaculaceae bacterium]|nr:ABC transporter permease [Muribaculaceae bacterium]